MIKEGVPYDFIDEQGEPWSMMIHNLGEITSLGSYGEVQVSLVPMKDYEK